MHFQFVETHIVYSKLLVSVSKDDVKLNSAEFNGLSRVSTCLHSPGPLHTEEGLDTKVQFKVIALVPE